MIKSMNKQINLNATSVITENDNDIIIAYMSANIDTNGRFNINQSIQDETKYFENIEVAKADYDEFYEKVVEIAQKKN